MPRLLALTILLAGLLAAAPAALASQYGRVVLRNSYDDQGRVASQRDQRRIVPGDRPTRFTYAEGADGSRVTTLFRPTDDPSWDMVVESVYDRTHRRLIRETVKPTADPATWS